MGEIKETRETESRLDSKWMVEPCVNEIIEKAFLVLTIKEIESRRKEDERLAEAKAERTRLQQELTDRKEREE
jgi:hypothetical protein